MPQLKRSILGRKLLKQSLSIMLANKKLFILPLLNGIIVLLLLTMILTPLYHFEYLHQPLTKRQIHEFLWLYLIFLLFLFICNVITFSFKCALIGCLQNYFDGKCPKLRVGIKKTISIFWPIYWWTSYVSTVGILINLSQNKLKNFHYFRELFAGQNWKIASFLILPIIVYEKLWPMAVFRRSTKLINDTWGAPAFANFSFTTLILLLRLVALIPLLVGVLIGGSIIIIISVLVTTILFLLISAVNSSTYTVLSCAVYLYASKKTIPKHFDEDLKNVFNIYSI